VSAPSTGPDLRPAALDDAALEELHRLEQRLGTPVVAYEAASPYADLSAEQLAEIQRTESALGVRLLAYRQV
jgi:maleate cis-trans isomerase